MLSFILDQSFSTFSSHYNQLVGFHCLLPVSNHFQGRIWWKGKLIFYLLKHIRSTLLDAHHPATRGACAFVCRGGEWGLSPGYTTSGNLPPGTCWPKSSLSHHCPLFTGLVSSTHIVTDQARGSQGGPQTLIPQLCWGYS